MFLFKVPAGSSCAAGSGGGSGGTAGGASARAQVRAAAVSSKDGTPLPLPCPCVASRWLPAVVRHRSPTPTHPPALQTILHTGDLRWHPGMAAHPALARQQIDVLMLDTTYRQPRWRFPPQGEAVAAMAAAMAREAAAEPGVWVGGWVGGRGCIGSLGIWPAAAATLSAAAAAATAGCCCSVVPHTTWCSQACTAAPLYRPTLPRLYRSHPVCDWLVPHRQGASLPGGCPPAGVARALHPRQEQAAAPAGPAARVAGAADGGA